MMLCSAGMQHPKSLYVTPVTHTNYHAAGLCRTVVALQGVPCTLHISAALRTEVCSVQKSIFHAPIYRTTPL